MFGDLRDRKLIAALMENSRASLSHLAKEIGLSREATHYRIKGLVKKGVIRGFLTALDFHRLGLISLAAYLKLRNIDEEKMRQMIFFLEEEPQVTWIASTGGRYDLVIDTITQNILQFDQAYSKFLSLYAPYILSSEIIIRLRQGQLFQKYRLPQKSASPLPNYHPSPLSNEVISLEENEKKIIQLLARNSRLSQAEMSKKLALSPTTLSYKIKGLQKRGLIQGYTLFLDAEKMGYQKFKTLLTLRDFSPEKEKKIFSYALSRPEISYFVKCMGKWNVELEMEVKNLQEYQKCLLDLRDKFGEIIQEMEFIVIFKEHKFTYFTEAMV